MASSSLRNTIPEMNTRMRIVRALLLASCVCLAPVTTAQRQYLGVVRAVTPSSNNLFPFGGIACFDSLGLNPQAALLFDTVSVGTMGLAAGIVQASNGWIYGLTGIGQIPITDEYPVFAYDPVTDSVKIVIRLNSAQYPWGGIPFSSSLLEADQGVLVGNAGNGGDNGSIFRYYTSNDSIALITLVPSALYQGNTLYPVVDGTLFKASNGQLYGAESPNVISLGKIARIDPLLNTYSTLGFNDPLDAYYPIGPMLEHSGRVYALTNSGGPGYNFFNNQSKGTIVSVDLATTAYTKELDFNDSIHNPYRGFTAQANGKWYSEALGVVEHLNPNDSVQAGCIFSYDPTTNTVERVVDYADPSIGYDIAGVPLQPGLLAASNGNMYGSFQHGLFEYDPIADTLVLRAPLQYQFGGETYSHGLQSPLIEICRKPNYKPRSTTSFNVCQGAYFFYDLQNVNATTVVWRRNGTIVPGQTSQLLEFAAITEGDEGVWACTLANECGVTEPPAITITVNAGTFTTSIISGDTLLCGTGDMELLSGNNGGTWSTGATSATLNVVELGTYYVYNQQTCGLSMSNAVHVAHLDSAVAPAQLYYFNSMSPFEGAQICPGAPPFVIGDNSGGPWHNQPSGRWQDGSSGASFTVQDTGYYYIYSTNACNSDTSNIAHVFYPVPPTPVAFFRDAFGQPADNLICTGDSVLVHAIAGQSYSVLLAGNFVGGASEDYPFVAHAAGTYALIAQPCPTITSDTAYFTIIVDTVPPPDAMIFPDVNQLTGCDQDTVYISSNYAYSYWQWQDANNNLLADTTTQLQVDWTITAGGLYTLYNYNGCGTSTPDMIYVQPTPAPEVLYTETLDTLCLSWPVQTLSAGTPTGGTYNGVGVSGNTFDPVAAGIGAHTITYSYSDGTCTGYAQDVVTVDACLGVDGISATAGIALYPNPNNGRFTVLLSGPIQQAQLVLVDAQGRPVCAPQRLITGANEIGGLGLAAGIYAARIVVNGTATVKTMMVVAQ